MATRPIGYLYLTGGEPNPRVWRRHPGLAPLDRFITGEDCFSVHLLLRSIEDLEAIIDQLLLYGRTTTSIVQSTPVPRRPLPLCAALHRGLPVEWAFSTTSGHRIST